ncbi:MarR family transcriptional regulator [Sphaerisporangium krabiense]|uniref:DNA-binding MarR family transcriptional regulator n=1 Tax=Sphaerisporangium krabiense TaxID=763782 RepID=A0A7W8YZ55_9ACTN|nr:MarR family transcriptional regulator [Sphaerisporangium krabiense]MBB5624492.1 DNA-binding MarR family transcriptional regulator [Sphaerisporangium krabiense]GII61552.1 MarR family transcriptional regulator [Sphaerisporangium krabiense]
MGETRWLDEDEQRAWRTFLWASRLLHESLDRQLQHDAGMPHTYYMILAMLSEAPGRSMTMTDLARLVRSSPSRLSHAVTKLEAQGWVTRRKRPGDARTNVATLTPEGFAALADAAPGHVEEVRRVLFDHLAPDQVRQLQNIFENVLTTLTSPDADQTPRPWP